MILKITKMSHNEYRDQMTYDASKAEEEEPYLCVDCGEDFKWKSGISSAGCGVNSYHCGSCNRPKWEWFNKKKKKIKFKVKNIDWVWCTCGAGNKIPKEDKAVGCSYCF